MAASQDFGELTQLDSAELERMAGGIINIDNWDALGITNAGATIDSATAALLLQQHSLAQSYQQSSAPANNVATVTSSQPQAEVRTSKTSYQGSAASAPSTSTARQHQASTTPSGVYVEITEQPRARGLRFRYECEGRSAGSIPGERSTAEKKTFPTIKIRNYRGHAVIVVSCVSKDDPAKPHPHNLVGKDCKKGVCTLKIKDTNTITFPHLGIQCIKKKDIDSSLKQRKEINVDPFQTGFKSNANNLDLNVVRLCFQVFLPDENGKITRIVPPVVSQAIHDKKAMNDLVICRVDKSSGRAKGGDEIFLLCEKICKDDIEVRFFKENDPEGDVEWEDVGDFGQNDIHRQFAIVFKTPAYKDPFALRPVEVRMQLRRISDKEVSESIPFTYMPEDPDPDRIQEKRKRKAETLTKYMDQHPGGAISPGEIKQRLKLKATRGQKPEAPKIKHEVVSPSENQMLPQYSYDNLGAQSRLAANIDGSSGTTMNVYATDNTGMGSVRVPKTSQVQGGIIFPSQAITVATSTTGQQIQYIQTSSGLIPLNPSQQIGLTDSGNPMYVPQDPGYHVIGSDVSMQSAAVTGAQSTNLVSSMQLDSSLLNNYLADQVGLGAMNLDFDPNVGAMESVASDEGQMSLDEEQKQQYTETLQALQNLN